MTVKQKENESSEKKKVSGWNPFNRKTETPKQIEVEDQADNTSMVSFYAEDEKTGEIKRLLISKVSEKYQQLMKALESATDD